MSGVRLLFAEALLRRMPPWLRRKVGGPIVRGLGDPLDQMATDTADGVRLRFPTPTADPDALALIGKERRILRGPGEAATTYALRLLRWWDDHRIRGGPYALLEQLYRYFLASLDVQMDVVYFSGRRFVVDPAGVITRDDISWDPLGWVFFFTPPVPQWSQIWIFWHLPANPGPLTPAQLDVYRAVPREWTAAHVKKTTLVLLFPGARLWGYPVPVPTWGTWGVWPSVVPTVFTT